LLTGFLTGFVTDILELTIERAVAGGRMLARHDGRIVLVEGAIPGERVRARVERRTKGVVFASTTDVMEASPDRREPAHDPACGGAAFAHIAYARQVQLKQEILVDAFRRQARIALEPAPVVASSPERGYRLRSRLHVAAGRVGYFREGTHTLCDAATTWQLSPDAARLAQDAVDALGGRASQCAAVIVSENVDTSARVLHLEPVDGAILTDVPPELATRLDGVTGVTTTAGRSADHCRR
jgi:23S rRNA (uracil1939-C5)-methyltransferase